ncbi:hypothetical protein AB0B56_36800 [Streptosporangium canum]|uniref:hypothetical protein n=1 Tax=Streptosporangium canum TaxID=324952 RepID=UPI00343538AB
MHHLRRPRRPRRDPHRTAIRELESHGYLVRERERGSDGRLGVVDYIFSPQTSVPTVARQAPSRRLRRIRKN